MMEVRMRIGNHEKRRPIARSCAVALAPMSPKAFLERHAQREKEGKERDEDGHDTAFTIGTELVRDLAPLDWVALQFVLVFSQFQVIAVEQIRSSHSPSMEGKPCLRLNCFITARRYLQSKLLLQCFRLSKCRSLSL